MIRDTFYTLNNGIRIPAIGLGTWQVAEGDEAYRSCLYALKAGYRHIDTAFAYGNERSVARAIQNFGIAREDVFITTKLPADIKDYDGTIAHFNESVNNLKTEYIDLYLIHAPWPWSDVGSDCTAGNIEVWRAMIDLYNAGRIRAIGVSNFHAKDIQALIDATGVIPAVNQIRFFIGNTQNEIYDFCRERGILIEAYSPLATGAIVEHGALTELAKKYGVSVAQLCIRYCIEKGTLPLPKSVNEGRIAENLLVDFEISHEDMAYLDSLYHIGPTRPYRS